MADPSSETSVESEDDVTSTISAEEAAPRKTRSRWAPPEERELDESEPEEEEEEAESVEPEEASHDDSVDEDSYAEDDSWAEESEVEDDASDKAAAVVAADTSATRYKLAIFVLLGLAGLMTLGAAVRFWLPPWAPLAVFGVFGVAPVLFWSFIGAFLFDPSKARDGVVTQDSPRLAQRLKMALAPVVAAGLMGALFAGLWYLAPVRSVVATVSATQRLTATLDAALVDESASVRLAACEGLSELKDDTSTRLLMSLNDESDEVAECALDAIPPYPEAPRELLVAANTWHSKLMTDETLDGGRACVLSNRMRVAERKGLTTAPMHLLDCALTAASDPAAECCAQSFRGLLGGNDVEPPMVMRPAQELLHRGFVKTLPALLQATHSKDAKWEQKRLMLRLDTPKSRAWAMSIGCEALNYGGADQREKVSAMMAKAVESQSCEIGVAGEKTVRLWTAVCSMVYSPEAVAVADGNEDERFCSAISSTLQIDATNEARRATQGALRDAKTPGRRAQMMKALLNYGGRIAKAMQENDGNAFGGKMGDMQKDDAGMFLMPMGDNKSGEGDMFSEMMQIFLQSQRGGPRGTNKTFDELMMDQAAKNLEDAGVDIDPRELMQVPSD